MNTHRLAGSRRAGLSHQETTMKPTITMTADQLASLVAAAGRARAFANEARDYADSAMKKAQAAAREADEVEALVHQIMAA
jgi:ABC-type transporter Mla subunit MlaD